MRRDRFGELVEDDEQDVVAEAVQDVVSDVVPVVAAGPTWRDIESEVSVRCEDEAWLLPDGRVALVRTDPYLTVEGRAMDGIDA